jgi:TP901 family phage tail tape measure protein
MTIGQTLMLKINAAAAVVGAKKFTVAAGTVSGSALMAGRSVNTLGTSLRMLAGGFLGLYVLRDAMKTIIDFEKTMRSVQVVVGATDKEMEKFIKTARSLGATTRFTATEAGEGMAFLARAGFEASDVLAMIPHTLNLATAAVIELGAASDMVANTIHQFNLQGRDAERVVDSLMITANSFNTTVFQLGNAMQYAGTFAGALGISLEETNVALGLMANTGIKSSMAGTALRGIFAALIKPTDKAMRAIKRLGLTASDVNPAIRTLEEVFHSLNEAGKGLADSTEFASLMLQIFARRPVPGALALAELNEEMGIAVQKQRDLAGETKRAANMMDDTFFGALKELRSAIQETWLVLGDEGLGGGLRDLTDIMTGTVRMFAGMEHQVEKFNKTAKALSLILKFIIARFVAMMVIKIISSLFLSMLSVVVMLTKGFKALALAQSLTIAGAIASAVAIMVTMYWEWSEGIAAVAKQQEKVNDAITSGMKKISDAKLATSGLEAIQAYTDGIKLYTEAAEQAKKALSHGQLNIAEDLEEAGTLGSTQNIELPVYSQPVSGGVGAAPYVQQIGTKTVEVSGFFKDLVDATKSAEDAQSSLLAVYESTETTLSGLYDTAIKEAGEFGDASTNQLKAVVDAANNLMGFRRAMAGGKDIAEQLGWDKDKIEEVLDGLNEINDRKREASNILAAPTGDDEAAEKAFEMIAALEEQIEVMGLVGNEKRRAIALQKIENIITKSGTSLHAEEAALLRQLNEQLQDGTEARASLTEQERLANAERERTAKLIAKEVEESSKQIRNLEFANQMLQKQITLGTEGANAIDKQTRMREAVNNSMHMAKDLQIEYLASLSALIDAEHALKDAQNTRLGAFESIKEQTTIALEQQGDMADAHARTRFEMEARVAWQLQYGELITAQGEAEIALLMQKYDLLEKEGKKKEEMLVTNEQMAQTMTRGIMDVVKGAQSMQEAFAGVILQLVEMIIQAMIYKMIMGMLPGGAVGGIPAAQNGMVLSGGQQMQNYAVGGVVNSPTLFPMASGNVGLMAEAGAEAIMPLTRMPDGKLGVSSQGEGGATKNVIVNMNITTDDADSFRKSKKQVLRDMRKGLRGVTE